jgi:hypothetical protein
MSDPSVYILIIQYLYYILWIGWLKSCSLRQYISHHRTWSNVLSICKTNWSNDWNQQVYENFLQSFYSSALHRIDYAWSVLPIISIVSNYFNSTLLVQIILIIINIFPFVNWVNSPYLLRKSTPKKLSPIIYRRMFSQLLNVYECNLIIEASPSTRNLDNSFNGELIKDFTCSMSCSVVSSDFSMNLLQDV